MSIEFSLSIIAGFTHKISRLAVIISAAGLVAMTLIVGWQVFARYVLNASPAWSESAALLLMLYYIMLAAAVGVYENFHLGLKFLLDSVSSRSRRSLEIINNSLIIVFGIAMLINGTRLAQFTANHVIPTLEISRALAYWPFATAGFMITLFALERLLLTVLNNHSAQQPNDGQTA